jgi:hypothetical protein
MKRKICGPSGWEFDVRQMPPWKTTHPKQLSEGSLMDNLEKQLWKG